MLQIAKANVAVVHVMAARLACRIYAPGGRLAVQITEANVTVVHVMAARLACRIYAPGGRLAVQITEANVAVVHVMAARLACNIYRENARTQINQTHNQHKRVPMLEHLRRTCANNGLAGPQWVLKDASSTRKKPKHENVMVTYFRFHSEEAAGAAAGNTQSHQQNTTPIPKPHSNV